MYYLGCSFLFKETLFVFFVKVLFIGIIFKMCFLKIVFVLGYFVFYRMFYRCTRQGYFWSYFVRSDIEVIQKVQVICLNLYSWLVVDLGFEFRQFGSRVRVFNYYRNSILYFRNVEYVFICFRIFDFIYYIQLVFSGYVLSERIK